MVKVKMYLQLGVACLFILNTTLFIRPQGHAQTPNLGPISVHIVNPMNGEQILPTTFPILGKHSTKIEITACRGEYEPASFVIQPVVRDLRNLRISATDLVGNRGIISKHQIDIRFVKAWYQAGGGWNTIGLSHQGQTRVLVPELLLKDDALIYVDEESKRNYARLRLPGTNNLVPISEPGSIRGRLVKSTQEFPISDTVDLQPITLRRSQVKQLWVTVHVPDNAASGTYSGFINLADDLGQLGQLEIKVQVMPFTLHAPKIEYSLYYRGMLSENPSISSEYKGRKQFIAELENMVAHGVKTPSVYQTFSRSELQDVLQIRKQVGIDNRSLFYLGTSTGNPTSKGDLDALRKRLRILREIADEHGIENVYLYGIDEAKGERLLSQRKAWDLAHDQGIKVFTAGYADAFSLVGDLLDLLVMAGKLVPSQAQSFHSMGHKIFSYANPQTGPENPAVFRRNYGLEIWRCGYDGVMPYAYQDSMGFIWNDFDHPRYRDHTFAYPTVDGVVDTLAWEGFREGVDDVRYVTTLEDVIGAQERPYTPTVLEALEYLASLRSSLPSDLDEVRARVISYLLLLPLDDRPPSTPNMPRVQ
ncbi:hypothetical protein FBQ96_09120 [Nitrospirales bacterium NOB]|nr:hypothetical protein [Nitrospirales bacterium NOB]